MIARAEPASVSGPKAVLCLLGAIGAIAGAQSAQALTIEEARERCRESVGRPTVQQCMHSHGYGKGNNSSSSAETQREACREQARPKVKACVEKMMAAAHGRSNTAVALPEEKVDPQLILQAPAATFVAPPRTISDITAVLDSERPDPAKINELRAKADAQPPAGLSKAARRATPTPTPCSGHPMLLSGTAAGCELRMI